MLSLLTCSVSHLDEFDPYTVPPPRLQSRRLTKGLGFVKTTPSLSNAKRRRLNKLTIGVPTDFRHVHHLGTDMIPKNMISLWDSARWQQEIEKEPKVSPPSSVASSVAPSSPKIANVTKRNSFTPQKRKPVPSLIPDLPAAWLPAAAIPQDIPLPPSPTVLTSEVEVGVSDRHSEESVVPSLLTDQPRQCPSVDECDDDHDDPCEVAMCLPAAGEVDIDKR